MWLGFISGYRRIRVGWLDIGGNAPFQGREFTMVEGRHHRWTLLRMHRLHILATSQKQTLSVSFPPAVLLCTQWHQCHHQHHQVPELLFKRPTMCPSSDQLLYLSCMKETSSQGRLAQKNFDSLLKSVWELRCVTTCSVFPCVNNSKLTPGHKIKGITALPSSDQSPITM